MKKQLTIFLLLGISALLFGQSQIPNDTIKIGQGSTASDKGIIFDTNDGVSNPKLQVDKTSKALKYDKNTFQLGDGNAASDKTISINGASKNFKFNGTTNQFEFDDDVKTSGKIKTDTIEAAVAGSPVAIENDLRVKEQLFIGTSTNELRVSGGNLEFSNDGSTYKKIGSGGGGGATGGINTLANSSFEDGVTTGWIATPAAVSATYTNGVEGNTKYATWDATTSGDSFKSVLTTKPDNVSGGCMADIMYNGGDANLALKVLNASATPIASQTLEAATTWKKSPTLTFPCASGMQLSLEATANAAAISLDDAYLGSNKGFFPIDKINEFSARIQNNGTASIISQSGKTWISSVNRSAVGIVDITFVSGFFSVIPACTVSPYVPGGRIAYLENSAAISINGVRVSTATTAPTATDYDFHIKCSYQGADATQAPLTGYASIPTHSRTNVLAAKIDNNGSTITVSKESGDWLGPTGTRVATGVFTVPANAGVFTTVPVCECTVSTNGDATPGYCKFNHGASTTTSLRFLTFNSAGSPLDFDASISCTKEGADFTNTLNVQNLPYLLNQVETTYSAGIRTESCRIANSGTPTLGTYCSSWVNSITDINVGRMDVNLKPGTFSSSPTCTVSGTTYANVAAATLTSLPGLNTVSISTYDPFATPPMHYLDIDLTLICTGAR